MRLSIYFLAVIFFCYLVSPLQGQDSKVFYPHTVFWSKVEANEIFPNNWGVGLDFVYRRKNALDEGSLFKMPLRESVRPWIHYQFSPIARLSISPIGYMNTNEYIGKPEDFLRSSYHEVRTTFQFYHHHKQLQGRLTHTWRYRYELRWQEVSDSEDYRFFTRFRLRYRIRYILNSNDFYENNILYLAVSNEIGLNLGRNVYLNTFNQNRLYAGVGFRFLNAMRVEARYVNRLRTRGSTGYEFDNGQGFMLGVYIDQVSKIGGKDIPNVKFYD